MNYREFIAKAVEAGEFDSEGSIRTDVVAMRQKLTEQLHGQEGLWLVSLFQSLVGTDCTRVSIQSHPGRFQVVFTTAEYPTPGEFAPYLTENKSGTNPREWCMLKALLSLPSHLQLTWHGPDGRLSREKEQWQFQSKDKKSKKPSHRILIVNSLSRENWKSLMKACSFWFPLPPYPLIWNTRRCWPELEAGAESKLLFRRGTEGEMLEIHAADTEGKVGFLIRLGLQRDPYHRIVYLDRGARIHHQELKLQSYFLSTEVFVSGVGMPTDLGGFSLRATESTDDRLRHTENEVLLELKKTLSKLISHPRLPLRFEEQRRQESVVSSAVALGGLSFLQVPFFPSLVTLGLATVLIGGIGLNSLARKRREPWRGEYGLQRIRRDMVEVRKQITAMLESFQHPGTPTEASG